MGTVIKFDPASWATMLMLKRSLAWYSEQPRENDAYGTATQKEKRLLRATIRGLERVAA